MTNDNAVRLWHGSHGDNEALTATYFGWTITQVISALARGDRAQDKANEKGQRP